jgi:hypothetical protein
LTKSPFSDKNPYPGCIASAPVFLAISMIFWKFKYDWAGGDLPI